MYLKVETLVCLLISHKKSTTNIKDVKTCVPPKTREEGRHMTAYMTWPMTYIHVMRVQRATFFDLCNLIIHYNETHIYNENYTQD